MIRKVLRGLRRIPGLIARLDRICTLLDKETDRLGRLEQKVDRIEGQIEILVSVAPPTERPPLDNE